MEYQGYKLLSVNHKYTLSLT